MPWRRVGRGTGVILADVVLEAVLAPLAHRPALRALSVARVDGVCVVGEVVPPPEGPAAQLALEALSAVHRVDVSVQAPLARQGPAAGAARVAQAVVGDDGGVPESVLLVLGEIPFFVKRTPTCHNFARRLRRLQTSR